MQKLVPGSSARTSSKGIPSSITIQEKLINSKAHSIHAPPVGQDSSSPLTIKPSVEYFIKKLGLAKFDIIHINSLLRKFSVLQAKTDQEKQKEQTRQQGQTVLKRSELEIAVLSHLADGIRCGDLYVIGSEEYADYREQLLPWGQCEARLLEYCQALGLPDSAEAFVRQLKDSLTDTSGTCAAVDAPQKTWCE